MPDSLSPSSLHIRWYRLMPGCLGGRHTPSCPSALLFISGLSRSSLMNNTDPPLKMKIDLYIFYLSIYIFKKRRGAVVLPRIGATVCTMNSLRSSPSAQVVLNSEFFYAINKKFTPDHVETLLTSHRLSVCLGCFFWCGGRDARLRDKWINSESTHQSPI